MPLSDSLFAAAWIFSLQEHARNGGLRSTRGFVRRHSGYPEGNPKRFSIKAEEKNAENG